MSSADMGEGLFHKLHLYSVQHDQVKFERSLEVGDRLFMGELHLSRDGATCALLTGYLEQIEPLTVADRRLAVVQLSSGTVHEFALRGSMALLEDDDDASLFVQWSGDCSSILVSIGQDSQLFRLD